MDLDLHLQKALGTFFDTFAKMPHVWDNDSRALHVFDQMIDRLPGELRVLGEQEQGNKARRFMRGKKMDSEEKEGLLVLYQALLESLVQVTRYDEGQDTPSSEGENA